MVRILAGQVLTEHGYTVLEAGRGDEAITVCREHQGPIHLLLTDIIMPGGVNGFELARQLLSLHPQLKVLYVSGYPGEAIDQQGLPASGMAFLPKPFSPLVLGQKVREVLDS